MSDSSTQFARLAEANDEAWRYADWKATGDLARAKLYSTAVRRLILLKPRSFQAGGAGGEALVNDLQVHMDLLKEAEKAISNANMIASQQSFVDFTCYRR